MEMVHGQGEAAQEGFEIGGVLAGGVDADVEVGLGMLVMELFEPFLQGVIAGPVFQDGERLGGRLVIGSEERNPMAVACGSRCRRRCGRGYAVSSHG